MARWLQVSKSGFYAWRKRIPSLREQNNQQLLDRIREIHEGSRGVYGSRKICRKLNRNTDKPVKANQVGKW